MLSLHELQRKLQTSRHRLALFEKAAQDPKRSPSERASLKHLVRSAKAVVRLRIKALVHAANQKLH